MRWLTCSFLFLLLSSADSAAQPQQFSSPNRFFSDTTPIDFNRRIALVIGNSDYSRDSLKNSVRDALDVAGLLEKYGFEVILDTNADRNATLKRIGQFGDSITRKKGVSVFYYSGHGMQYKSQNHLLPVRTEILKEEDIPSGTVKVNKVFEKMNETGNGLNIVILDACRNNVFQKKIPTIPEGLTDKELVPGNTYLFFAASPGKIALDGTGVHSPFTESLLQAITDSIEFFQVVKKVIRDVKGRTRPVQQPAIAGSPEDDFIFTAGMGRRIAAWMNYQPDMLRVSGPAVLPFVPFQEPRFTNRSGITLYVLSIGISKYTYLSPLMYADKDALDIARTLSYQSKTLYDSVETYVLLNESATRIKILSAIREITKKAKAGDMIMLFFGGHNIRPENAGTSYFVPVDTGIDYIETVMNGIEYERVKDFLGNAPCKSLLFLDGDYSVDMANGLSDIENGVAVMASSSFGERSMESPKWRNGLFARSLIDGMAGLADEDSSGYVSVTELWDYVSKRARTESENRQHPRSFINSVLANFKIAKALPPEILKEMRMKDLLDVVPSGNR